MQPAFPSNSPLIVAPSCRPANSKDVFKVVPSDPLDSPADNIRVRDSCARRLLVYLLGIPTRGRRTLALTFRDIIPALEAGESRYALLDECGNRRLGLRL